MKAYIKTYGCTLNQADGEIIGSLLSKSGIGIAASEKDADVVILNTCTVKEQTQTRIIQKLRSLSSSGKAMVVTGCMASANQDIIRRCAPEASIVSVHNISSMPAAVSSAKSNVRMEMLSMAKYDRAQLYTPSGSPIAKIPINDGCLSSCSFCETRFARGSLNSFSEDAIVRAISSSVSSGAVEIELASQDTGAYGRESGSSIIHLMERVGNLEGSFRVRIGMMNPEHLRLFLPEFINLLSREKFYKFAHIPIQSGSERVLSMMNRCSCTPNDFAGFVSRMRDSMPGMTIETDIIVGFPGETEEDFEDTLDMLRKVRPDVTNISRFTRRPHARASKLKQLSPDVINSRSLIASRLVRSIQAEINSGFVGREFEVTLTAQSGEFFVGRDMDYRHMIIPKEGMSLGDRIRVRAVSSSAYSIICEPA